MYKSDGLESRGEPAIRDSRQTVVMKVTLIFRCKEHNKGQHNMGGVSIER